MAISHSSLRRFSKFFLNYAPSICLAFGCLFYASFAQAELKLGTTFTDNMVLQRDRDLAIWGESDPGSSISIHVGTNSASAVADAQGHWSTSLKPLPVGGPYSATISNGIESIGLKNILSGDVWLCSGQSNMQFGLGEDIAAVAMRKKALSLPNLRLLPVPKFGADKPNYRIDAEWVATDSPVLEHFSAVAMHMGLALSADPKLAGVPIGLIDSSFGGTAAEGWTTKESLTDLNSRDFSPSMFNLPPSSLYNNMIAPLGPLSLTGVVWYQGESNAGKPEMYARIMGSLISTWRKQFGRPDLPFIIVQLPPFTDLIAGYPFTWLRGAEAQIVNNTPNTGLVVSIDTANGFNLHPRDKGEIGRRAALQARRLAYHEDVVADGPVFKSISRDGSSMRVTFDTHGSPLTTRDLSPTVKGFAIAGDDYVFHFADAVITGDDTVMVHCSDVPEPKYLRYAWAAVPDCNLSNRAGLPAGPFRTDNLAPEPSIELEPVVPARHVSTGSYDVILSGSGDLISFGVNKQQFISNNLDGSGSGNFPTFFGPRQLQDAVLLTGDTIRYSDGGVSVTYHFANDAVTATIHNLSKSSNDKINFHLHLADGVHLIASGNGFDAARGNSHLLITGADIAQDDPNGGGNVDLAINGDTSRTLTFTPVISK